MKKIIISIILGFLLAGLILPVVNIALAQNQSPNECCKIGADFSMFAKSKNADGTGGMLPIQWGHKKLCLVGKQDGQCVISDKTYLMAGDGTVISDDSKYWTCGEKSDNEVAIEGWGMICLLNTVYTVVNWIFYLMMIAVVIVFVIAGARFMMTKGDPEKTKNAKGMMVLAIIGLIIALVAKLVPSVIKMIVGM